jgi:hypothetical protein
VQRLRSPLHSRSWPLPAVSDGSHLIAALFAALVLIFGLSQIPPLAFIGLIEGFQHIVLSIANDLARGCDVRADLGFPFTAQYFLLSRFGLDAGLAWLQPLIESHLHLSLTLVMLISLMAYGWASLRIGRALYGVPLFWNVAGIILCPAMIASAYFLNDSLPSAALATSALALHLRRPTWPATILAGALLGLATAVRIDAAFLAPAFIAISLFDQSSRYDRLARLAVLGGIAILVSSAVYATANATLFDVLIAGREAIRLFDQPSSVFHSLKITGTAITIVGLGAIALGAWRYPWPDNRRALWITVAAVLGYALPYAGTLYQNRYLLPVLPFAAGLLGHGLRRAFGGERREHSVLPLALTGAALLLFVPFVGGFAEGPRAVVGNFWNNVGWMDWLPRVWSTSDRVLDLVGGGTDAAPERTIVSVGWSEERLVHLALERAGYSIEVPPVAGLCTLARERWHKGSRSVSHVRLHVPFSGASADVIYQRLIAPCLDGWHLRDAPVTVIWGDLQDPIARSAPVRFFLRNAAANWVPQIRESRLNSDILGRDPSGGGSTSRAGHLDALLRPDSPLRKAPSLLLGGSPLRRGDAKTCPAGPTS